MDNKDIYNNRYEEEIPYKYKTNTRYQRYLIKKCERYIDSKHISSLLDIGCGKGLNTALFRLDYPWAKITGIDISDIGISWAKKHYSVFDNLEFVTGDICKYAEEGQRFDMVCAFELLEHIEDWEKVADNMTRISDRYIMISAPIGRMRPYEVMHGHYRNFKKHELEKYFTQKGFKTVKTYYAGFPFWSPITRDLLQLSAGGVGANNSKRYGVLQRITALTLFYLYKYFSLVHIGDQFVGLFEKTPDTREVF